MKSAKRIKGSQGKGYYTDRMEALTLEFSGIATTDKFIKYTFTPIVSKLGGWRVSKAYTKFKDEEMKFHDAFLISEDDIYHPNTIVLHTPQDKYVFEFTKFLNHIGKRDTLLGEYYKDTHCVCDPDDDCDCDYDLRLNKQTWLLNNFFLTNCGLFRILQSYKDKGIREFKKQELVGKECPVSLEPLKVGETFKLPCDHYISQDAFCKMKGIKKCPLCRTEAQGEDLTAM